MWFHIKFDPLNGQIKKKKKKKKKKNPFLEIQCFSPVKKKKKKKNTFMCCFVQACVHQYIWVCSPSTHLIDITLKLIAAKHLGKSMVGDVTFLTT